MAILLTLLAAILHCSNARRAHAKRDIFDEVDFYGSDNAAGTYYDYYTELLNDYYDILSKYKTALNWIKNHEMYAMDAMAPWDGVDAAQISMLTEKDVDKSDVLVAVHAIQKATAKHVWEGRWDTTRWKEECLTYFLAHDPVKKAPVIVAHPWGKGKALTCQPKSLPDIIGADGESYGLRYDLIKAKAKPKCETVMPTAKPLCKFAPTMPDMHKALQHFTTEPALTSFRKKSVEGQSNAVGAYIGAHAKATTIGVIPTGTVRPNSGRLEAGELKHIYHEGQSAALCGLRALNNMWQEPIWNPLIMDKIADGIAKSVGQEAVRDGYRDANYNGHYSLSVLQVAMDKVGYTTGAACLVRTFTETQVEAMKNGKFVGFLINFATEDGAKHVAYHYISIRYMMNVFVYIDSILNVAHVMTNKQVAVYLTSHSAGKDGKYPDEVVCIITEK